MTSNSGFQEVVHAYLYKVAEAFAYAEESLTITPGVANCIRAITGNTCADTPDTAFDTDTFNEKDYLADLEAKSIDSLTMNW
jgi:hypothetical protein